MTRADPFVRCDCLHSCINRPGTAANVCNLPFVDSPREEKKNKHPYREHPEVPLCSKNGDPDERQGSRRPGGRKIEVAGPIRGPPGEQKRLAPLKYILSGMAAAGCPSFGGPVPVGLQRTYWGPAVQELGPHSRLQGHQAALARWHPLALPVTGGRVPLGQIIGDPLTPEMERKRVTY